MNIILTLHDTDSVRCGDIEVKTRKGPICALARKLMAAGRDGAEPVTVLRGKTVCFTVQPLSWWAERTVSESNHKSAHFVKWVPFPKALYTSS